MSTWSMDNRLNNGSDVLFNESDGSGGSGASGRPGGGGGGRWRNKPCGYCNATCVYNAIEMGFVIGIFANIIVIFRVYRDKKLRNPTFITIACLAFADALFLTVNLVRSFDDVILTITCGYPSKIVSRPWYILQSVTWFAANSHVALMAILRYITIAYPLRSNLLLSVKRVIFMSGLVWLLGLILIGTLSILISYGYVLPARSQEFVIILWTTVYLMPLCFTVVLHILKMCVVKSTTRESATEATKKAIRRMSKIVLMVILFATILPLPRLINKFLRVAGVANAYPSKEFGMHYTGISELLFLINHFINPFMYGFLSKKFRNSIKDMLWFLRLKKTDEGSKETTDTPLSSRRRDMSLDPITPISSNVSLDTLDTKNL